MQPIHSSFAVYKIYVPKASRKQVGILRSPHSSSRILRLTYRCAQGQVWRRPRFKAKSSPAANNNQVIPSDTKSHLRCNYKP